MSCQSVSVGAGLKNLSLPEGSATLACPSGPRRESRTRPSGARLKVATMDSPHLYRRGAPPGRRSEVIERAIALDQAQSAAGVAPILTLNHLAVQSGVGLRFLEEVTSRTIDPYRLHLVRKRSGTSKRRIAAPSPELYQVQRWLLEKVFSRVPTHEAAFAYVRGRSAPECARQHLGASWMLKVDVQDFFHQFDEVQIYQEIKHLNFSPLVSLAIARLTTRHTTKPQAWLPAKYAVTGPRRPQPSVDPAAQLAGLLSGAPTPEPETWLPFTEGMRLGYLPQGAPTSGAIANLLSRQLDKELAATATAHRMTYTRYADDITLSSCEEFDRHTAQQVLHQVRRAIVRNGLIPHPMKSKIVTPGMPLQVLGVRVDGTTSRLSKRIRQRIEFHLRGAETFGVANHATHCGFTDALGFSHHLGGLIRYAFDVEPGAAIDYFVRFDRVVAANDESLLPR